MKNNKGFTLIELIIIIAIIGILVAIILPQLASGNGARPQQTVSDTGVQKATAVVKTGTGGHDMSSCFVPFDNEFQDKFPNED